jgi:hypothetical protein
MKEIESYLDVQQMEIDRVVSIYLGFLEEIFPFE